MEEMAPYRAPYRQSELERATSEIELLREENDVLRQTSGRAPLAIATTSAVALALTSLAVWAGAFDAALGVAIWSASFAVLGMAKLGRKPPGSL